MTAFSRAALLVLAVALVSAPSASAAATAPVRFGAPFGSVIIPVQLRPEIRSFDPDRGLRFEGDAPAFNPGRRGTATRRPAIVQPAPLRPTVGSPVAPRAYSAQWYRYCADRYESFEPRTGLYTTYSGRKRACR